MIFGAALRKEILEQWRTYRLVAVVIIIVAFGIASPLLAKLTPQILALIPGGEDFVKLIPEPTIADALTQYVKNVSQFAVLLAIFTTMGAVAQEKERGTAVLVLVKPLGRGTFLAAKFIALSITFLLAIVLAAIGGYYYTVFLFGAPDMNAWVLLNVLLFVYTLVYVAITLLASTMTRSQAVAAALGFAALLFLSALGALPTIGRYLPGQLLGWGTMAFTDSSATAWPALTLSLGLIAVSLLTAWLVLERQEL